MFFFVELIIEIKLLFIIPAKLPTVKKDSMKFIRRICSFEFLVMMPIVLYTLILINAKQKPGTINKIFMAINCGTPGITKQLTDTNDRAINIARL